MSLAKSEHQGVHSRLKARFTSAWWQVIVLLGVCGLVYWLGLGVKPLDFSEGHRCVPGWTMLRSGEWWHQEMFGLTYVRKPPGMAWAIGASAAVFGESAWSARGVSAACATLMALIAWGYTRRWFGARWGVFGGLSQALMPLMWSPGRSAEIEMLMLLGSQMASLGIVGLTVRAGEKETHERAVMAVVDVVAILAGVLIFVMAKGPAGGPIVAGAIAGGAIGGRTWKVLRNPLMWGALIVGGSLAALLLTKFAVANQDAGGVREDVAGQFLWSITRVGGVVLLTPTAWVSMLPMSVAVIGALWVWWRWRARDSHAESGEVRETTLAGMLAWAWVAGVVVLVCTGVSNARYAMVCAVVLPPLTAWSIKAVCEPDSSRERFAWACAGMLSIAGVVLGVVGVFPTRDQRAGRELAMRLSIAMPPGVTIWADDAIEARPDIVWEMRERSNRLGKGVRVVWAKGKLLDGTLPARGECVLLRTDAQSGEADRFKDAIVSGALQRLSGDKVRTGEYTLFRVRS